MSYFFAHSLPVLILLLSTLFVFVFEWSRLDAVVDVNGQKYLTHSYTYIFLLETANTSCAVKKYRVRKLFAASLSLYFFFFFISETRETMLVVRFGFGYMMTFVYVCICNRMCHSIYPSHI